MTSIVDIDAHYFEYGTLGHMAQYLDEDDPWRKRFAQYDDPDLANPQLFPKSTGDRKLFGRISRDDDLDLHDAEDIPRVMDYLGVDDVVVISQRVLAFGVMDADDKRASKFANMYVEYMIEEVVDSDEGIYTLLPAPYHDPEATVDLIERVADEPGIVGVCIITGGAEPPLGNRKYEPIYAAAERADLPVVFHTGGAGLDSFQSSGYEKFIETHTLGFLTSNASQLTSVVIQGIPKKFPDLDILFVESGLFYVPMLMHRLDAEYMKRPSEVPFLDKRPSEYMKEIYYGTQPLEYQDEQHLEWVIRMMGGPDRLLWASDYPHWDYDPPKVIEDLSFLSRAEKDRVLGGNAREVFGL